MKITKIYPRDIIAAIVLIACFILMSLGIDSFVSGLIILVVTFYFARRTDGEGEPEKDINQKVKKLEEEIKELPKQIQPISEKKITATFGKVVKPEPGPATATGDFKIIPTEK